MNTLRQFAPLIVLDYITDVFKYTNHGHTYYELIYLNKGKGVHFLNNNQITYRAGDLFLLSPGDRHHFKVMQATQFIVIKFTDAYFDNRIGLHTETGPSLLPKLMMEMQSFKEVKLTFTTEHQSALKQTIKNIAGFKDVKNVETSSYVYFQILSLFGLISDVLRMMHPSNHNDQANKQKLISYINQNIYDPKKCQINTIAIRFGISTTYFGDYFKKNFGISYRDYLNQYRIKLIKLRIKGGQSSMKQIAQEFGFNDESHFSNYFNKQLRVRPAQYKKNS
jgi:AraC-like DNA-binding protein